MYVNIELSPIVQNICHDLYQCGGEVYIYGYALWDTLLHRNCDEYQIAVTSLSKEDLIEKLSCYGEVVLHYQDIQLKELPEYYFSCDIQEIYTVDCLKVSYPEGLLYNKEKGFKDLMEGNLRFAGEFPLKERVFHGAILISRYLLQPSYEVIEKSQSLHEEYPQKSLYEDFKHVLMGVQPSLGLQFIRAAGFLPSYLEALVHCDQRKDFHPEGSVWNHTLLVVDLCANIKNKMSCPEAFMWSALLHDIGKPKVTTSQGHATLHNIAGVEVFSDEVDIVSDALRPYISMMIEQHMILMTLAIHNSEGIYYQEVLKKIRGIVPLEDLIWLTRCDKMGRGYIASEQIEMFNQYMDKMKLTYGKE